MTPLNLGLILLAQVALVTGHVFLKRAMNLTHGPSRRAALISNFAVGIAVLTFWFFLWLGLLQKLDLSVVYPLEGLSPVLLVLAAALFLHERPGWRAYLGAALIAAGVVLVGLS